MWSSLSKFLLAFRLPLLILLALATGFMAFLAKDVQLSYVFEKIIPADHPKFIEYKKFIDEYGEDGNLLLIGMQSDKAFEQPFFTDWYQLGKELENETGVLRILSLAHAFEIQKDTSQKNFVLAPIVDALPANQSEMDALKTKILSLPFYKGLLYNDSTNAYIMAVSIQDDLMDSKDRNVVVHNIEARTEAFAQKHQVDLHYSGLPYLRAFRTTEVTKELRLFTFLSVIFAIGILLLLFRSIRVVAFPVLIFLIGITWVLGLIVFFGFKISLLTGLVPPLIVVISVPNCVYMINNYLKEREKGLDKENAIQQTIQRVGSNIFFANLTTAIGFSVFAFMESQLLKQFGIIAGLSIASLFVTSMIIVPFLLRSIPEQLISENKLKNPWAERLMDGLANFVYKFYKPIQIVAVVLALLTVFGILRIKSQGYIFDDVSPESLVYKDLKFFEKNFDGVLPLDILIDTGKKKGVNKKSTLKKLDKLQERLAANPLISRPLLVTEGLKFATQGFYGGNEDFYKLPGKMDEVFIFKYLSNTTTQGSDQLLNAFTDSTQQIARVSMQMADVGSGAFPALLAEVQTEVEKLFKPEKYPVTYTGTSLIAIEGYNYLVNGLLTSVGLAFLLITLVVVFLFRDIKMLLIALIPNIIPLLVTAAIMGYSNIHLKPSTVLIFSVAFGISVDFTIHFLTKYRQEIQAQPGQVRLSVGNAIRQTGLSMFYTAIIIFFGFIIFAASNFQGTFYLGILTSITVIVALLTNLIVLPSILLTTYKELGIKN